MDDRAGWPLASAEYGVDVVQVLTGELKDREVPQVHAIGMVGGIVKNSRCRCMRSILRNFSDSSSSWPSMYADWRAR